MWSPMMFPPFEMLPKSADMYCMVRSLCMGPAGQHLSAKQIVNKAKDIVTELQKVEDAEKKLRDKEKEVRGVRIQKACAAYTNDKKRLVLNKAKNDNPTSQSQQAYDNYRFELTKRLVKKYNVEEHNISLLSR